MNQLRVVLKQQKVIFGIVLICLILRLAYLEQWLSDWDSIQLALGLTDYSIVKHQPHPPGYPLYILLGKAFFAIFNSEVRALTILSALAGTLSIIPLYLLVRKIFDKPAAILASILFIFIPVVWLLSVTALTDIVGLFGLISAAYLFYQFLENIKAIVWLSLLAGILIGVRFNEFPVLVGLIIFAIVKQKNLKYAFFQILAFISGILLWLVPMIILTGWNQFIQVFTENGSYVVAHDVLLGTSHSFLGLIKAKTLLILNLIQLGFTFPLMLTFLLSFVYSISQKKLYSELWFQLCLIWIFSYSILLFSFFNLELPRHILPLLIPFLIISLYCFQKLANTHKLFWVLPTALILFCSLQSYSQVSRYHSTLPPSVAPVLYVKQNFNPKNTIIYSSFTHRSFEFYAPEFVNIDKDSDKSLLTKDKIVIVDHLDLKKDPVLEKFVEVDTKFYTADKDVFPKVNTVQLLVLKYKE